MTYKYSEPAHTNQLDYFLEMLAETLGSKNYRKIVLFLPHLWLPKFWHRAGEKARFTRATMSQRLVAWSKEVKNLDGAIADRKEKA